MGTGDHCRWEVGENVLLPTYKTYLVIYKCMHAVFKQFKHMLDTIPWIKHNILFRSDFPKRFILLRVSTVADDAYKAEVWNIYVDVACLEDLKYLSL